MTELYGQNKWDKANLGRVTVRDRWQGYGMFSIHETWINRLSFQQIQIPIPENLYFIPVCIHLITSKNTKNI
jgi:hypothetical protein